MKHGASVMLNATQRHGLALLARLILVLTSAAAWAQTPAPQAFPNLDLLQDGLVHAVARQPDGGVVFGGLFSKVNGIPRSNLARLLPNGALDPNWNPSPNGPIYALAVDPSGAVYVGGAFFSIGGGVRSNIAKLSGSGMGAADPDWRPWANNDVTALAVDASGAVYVGGRFTAIGGELRNRIAKLSGSGAGWPVVNWKPPMNGAIRVLAVDASGAVYVGGLFTKIGGELRRNIAKLSGSGTGAADPVWNPSADSMVNALAVDSSGAVYVGGHFVNIGGASRSRIAKLSSSGTGAADPNWNPSANNSVSTLAVDVGGAVYAGGTFTSIGGVSLSRIAKLSGSGTGAADPAWKPLANNDVDALAVGAGGTVYAGGAFTSIDGQTRVGLAILNVDGSVASKVANVQRPGEVLALALQSDGGLIVGGTFTHANTLGRNHILRVQPDGTLDPIWNPWANAWVAALAVDAGGAVYAGGGFSSIGGESRSNIAKLSGSGTGAADPGWNPSASGQVDALAVNASGAVYVGGSFTNIGGESRDHIAKLSGSGSGAADPVWNPSANNPVLALAVDASGAVYAGGHFTSIGGASRSHIAKLSGSGTGAPDANWSPLAVYQVLALAVDASDAVYAGGAFTYVGSIWRAHIAKLSGSGTGAPDPDWNPSADSWVYALAVDANGAVYAGGDFSNIGGASRSRIAKLSGGGTGAADPHWNPDANAAVRALAVNDSTGSIYVGGLFSTMGNQPRSGLARFLTDADPIFAGGSFE